MKIMSVEALPLPCMSANFSILITTVELEAACLTELLGRLLNRSTASPVHRGLVLSEHSAHSSLSWLLSGTTSLGQILILNSIPYRWLSTKEGNIKFWTIL